MKQGLKAICSRDKIMQVARPEEETHITKAWRDFYEDITVKNLQDLVKPSGDVQSEVHELLAKMQLGYDSYTDCDKLYIDVNFGDWKHDHAAIDETISTVFGFRKISEYVTEKTGSDNYSATHIYLLES